MKTIIALLLMVTPAMAWNDGGSYADRPEPSRQRAVVKPEPAVVVDRNVLSMNDVRNDKTVLIAGKRVTPKFEVSEPKPISAEQVEAEYLGQANPMADVNVTVSTEDVGVTHYHYTDKGFTTNN